MLAWISLLSYAKEQRERIRRSLMSLLILIKADGNTSS